MRKVWLVATAWWLVLSVLICAFYPLMVFDSIARYAPMAEAFARGDWHFAFHPRFGVIFPPLTGVLVWLFGIGGDHACQIVSTAFLAFAAVPVWAIAKRLYDDDRVAWIAVILVWIATEYLTYIEDGLRDPGRTLGLALSALAFLNRRSWHLSLGIFLLATIKVDLYAFSCVLVFVWFVLCCWHRTWLKALPPIASWLAATLLMCSATYYNTGVFLPLAQFVKLYLKLTGGVL